MNDVVTYIEYEISVEGNFLGYLKPQKFTSAKTIHIKFSSCELFQLVSGEGFLFSTAAATGRATAHKEDGNELFRKRQYKGAIKEYSKGISERSKDSELNAILYCNRAAAQFHLGKLSSLYTTVLF